MYLGSSSVKKLRSILWVLICILTLLTGFAGTVTVATGGSSISADSTGGAYAALTGPIYTETANGDISTTGTIILSAPTGFVFDTGGTAPTVLVTGDANSTKNINNLASGSTIAVTRTASTLTITITSVSTRDPNTLTWQNVRVRPSAGTPLATGNITKSGTATMAGVTGGTTSFGTLTEVVGAATKLTIQTQPATTATAGTALTTQPKVRIEDQFGNLRSADTLSVVASGSAGTVQGTTTISAVAGVATYSGIFLTNATSTTLTFSSGALTTATSGTIAVSPASANRLRITTQPSTTATAGTAFTTQPVVRIEDVYGNLRSADTLSITAASSSGTLQGTTTVAAVAGVTTFSGLFATNAPSITITFSSGALTTATSGSIAVSPAAANRLRINTQPATTATAGVAFTTQPVVQIEDTYGNLRNADTLSITAASSSGTLQGTVTRAAVGGIATFTDLFATNAASITLSFSSGALTTATSGTIAVSPAAANRLRINTQPATTATAGVAFTTQPVVQIEDTYGNLRSADTLSITAASSSGTLQGTVTRAAVGGIATFTDLFATNAASITLSFSSGALTTATSGTIAVSPAAANRLRINTQPATTATAGVAFTTQPVVQIEDTYGNLRSADTLSITAASSSGTLQGTVTRAAVGGIATFTDLFATNAASITLTFSSGALTSATSGTIAVSPASANRLRITTQPATTATAGTAFTTQPVVQIEDVYGNVRSADTLTITAASSSGTLQGTTSVAAVAGVTTFSGLFATNVANITLTFSSGALTTATSGSIAVSPAAANRLRITTQPSTTATAGAVFGTQPVVQIEDQFGNVRTGDTLSITAASSSGTLQGTTSVSAVAGVTTYSGLFATNAANITITFSSGALTTATSGSIAVSPATANRLRITTQPSATATAGVAFGTQPVVQIEDVYGNLRSADTLSINAASSSGTLQGTTSVAAVGGVTTFSGLFATNAANITLTFSSGALTTATSGSIAVSPAAANRLRITTQPSATATAGVAFSTQPVVQIEDVYGNLRSADTLSITAAGSSGTLQGTTSVAAVAGVTTFSGLFATNAANITLTFSSGALATATSGSIAVSPAAANRLRITTEPSTTATAGVAFSTQPVVQIEDVYGNLRSADTLSITAASSSGTLQGTTSVAAVAGVTTFSGLFATNAGSITLTFSSGALSTATSGSIAVSPAAANHLRITTQPSATATAGVAFGTQPVVQIEDQYGNLRNGDTLSISAASSSGTLQGTTSVAAVAGVTTFSGLFATNAASITLTFSSGALTPATSTSIAVAPANATQLAFTTQPASATVGSAFGIQPVVVSRDQYGNDSSVSLGASSILTMALTSGSGSLLGTVTKDIGTGAGNGVATFTNLRIDSAGAGKQLTASVSGLTAATSATFSVAQGPQTITFGALGGKQYGDASFPVSASSSSGLAVTFSIFSGPATVSGNNVTITGAGTVTVRASQSGNADYVAATPVDKSFVVTQAPLTVTADNQSRVFGAPNPTFTASYSGFVYSDTAAVLTGAPSVTTTATSASATGTYAISAVVGTLASSNYAFTFIDGTLTIGAASSSGVLVSSANPAAPGANVTFTATLSAVAPSTATPNGSIQFRADGTALGAPVALVSGVASVSTSALTHGAHTITSEYAGNGNFIGVTNSLNQSINTAPAAVNDTFARSSFSGYKVRVSSLLANDTDADIDTLSLSTFSATSVNGGSVVQSGLRLFYTPPAGPAAADSFTYTITDGGLTSTATVSITIAVDNTQSQNIVGIDDLGGGSSRVRFSGVIGKTYTIQYSESLVTPAWVTLGTSTADGTGDFSFTDTPPNGSPARYYRSIFP